MRLVFATLLIASSCAAKQQPAAAPDPLSPASTQPSATTIPAGASEVPTDDLLDAMEKVGVELRSLKADVAMKETDAASGDDATRTGTIRLQRRGPGDTRGHVVFEKLTANGRIIMEKIEYLLDGDWVIDRVYGRSPQDQAGKRETRRQIRKPGDKTDLLKLGEGPFPLPIGQPRDAVEEQFVVTKLPPDETARPGLVGLELRPKESNRLSRQYETITVWVDPHDAMPRVIETVAPDSGPVKTTTLTNVTLNEGVTDTDFVLAPVDADWTVVTEPYKDNTPK
jgi:hypothetical protein